MHEHVMVETVSGTFKGGGGGGGSIDSSRPNWSCLFVGIFNGIRVTLITGLLQTTDQGKLRKSRVSNVPRHVSD